LSFFRWRHDQHGVVLAIAFAAQHDARADHECAVDVIGAAFQENRAADAIGTGFHVCDAVDGTLDFGVAVFALRVGEVAGFGGLVRVRAQGFLYRHRGDWGAVVEEEKTGENEHAQQLGIMCAYAKQHRHEDGGDGTGGIPADGHGS